VEAAAANKTKEYLMSSAATRIQPGKTAPDIEFPSPSGEMISLSSLQGKVVLLDFWASWCRPCRAENPNVVKMYNAYKDKGFEIFSFSLDQDKAKWINAIQKDGLVWENHSSDLKGWNTETLPLYGLKGIPFTVLIDRDGKIIETNLRGQALENKLKTILG
jgi:peroxiredoxin